MAVFGRDAAGVKDALQVKGWTLQGRYDMNGEPVYGLQEKANVANEE